MLNVVYLCGSLQFTRERGKVHTHTPTPPHTHIHTPPHTPTHTPTHTHAHTHTPPHTHTHTHTHPPPTHTHTPVSASKRGQPVWIRQLRTPGFWYTTIQPWTSCDFSLPNQGLHPIPPIRGHGLNSIFTSFSSSCTPPPEPRTVHVWNVSSVYSEISRVCPRLAALTDSHTPHTPTHTHPPTHTHKMPWVIYMHLLAYST